MQSHVLMTRRQFGLGTAAAAFATSLAVPNLSARSVPVNFAVMADAWRESALRYEALHQDTFFKAGRWQFAIAAEERERIDAARARMIRSLLSILDNAALCRRDVQLKYLVLDETFVLTRPGTDFSEAQYYRWCMTLEEESGRFDAGLHLFWRTVNPDDQNARIDGVKDKHAPAWKEVGQWLLQ